MTSRIKLINKYGDEDCYLHIGEETPLFNICDQHGEHIEGYYLFSVNPNGLIRDEGVVEDVLTPSLETVEEENYKLIITGVDELWENGL